MSTQYRVGSSLLGAAGALLVLLLSTTPAAAATPPCARLATFSAASFPAQPKIDNPMFPLAPGSQKVLEGRSNTGSGLLPHRIVFTVTNLTKVINGVRTMVAWNVDYNQDVVAESELAFWAQDNQGNVWNLGQYPELWSNGVFAGAPDTWFAGLAGAEGGIHMPTTPVVGQPYYIQGWAPSIKFLDCATAFAANQSTCVPAGCFNNVLITDEYNPQDKAGGHQRKFYAPGMGTVQVDAVNDPEGETLVLAASRQLSPQELADLSTKALELEQRGYQSNPVYQQTARSDAPPPTAPAPAAAPAPAPGAAPAPAPGAASAPAPAPSPAPAPAPAPPTPPAPAPARPTSPTSRLSLSVSVAQRATRTGQAVTGVRCRGTGSGVCRGQVELFVRGTRSLVGAARFAVSAGRQQTLRIRLSKQAQRVLSRGGRLRLVARARGAQAGARSVVATSSVTLASR